MKLRFFDFDGCLFDSPMPETGKIEWGNFYNTTYPYVGWWGRLESMDLVAFNILPREEVYNIYNTGVNADTIDFVLTSRLLRFHETIKELLHVNDINIVDENILTKNKYEKGERILQVVKKYIDSGSNITDVFFYDDRDREIDSANLFKDEIEMLGVKFHIIQIT